ncbi:hypothetical protein NEMBOFW57_007811 [Staphylotrichum longicolle]|uniref:DUF8021 domain-containing protein n=1 Tax=Staphylotrichum longicolle TaxID=669026 RepID=A0AAD4EVS9_9PEZI|nr:hypothetical protein NEMBOFW57_007811 [Staphylotrichum longicolle]
MPTLLSTLLTLTLSTTLTAAASSPCPRPFLQSATAAYLAAQTAGQPSLFTTPFTPPTSSSTANLIYLENNALASLRTGVLATPLKVDFSRSIHDPDQCAAFTEIIAASDPRQPHVIHTRMVFDAASQRATLIESVVTTTGDWLFNATGTLNLNAGEAWAPIPEGPQRASRAEVQALGDAYFDRFGNVSVVVPWGAPCYRLEGGLPARGEMKGEECVMVWPSTIVVPYRRYVVDVEMGAVDMFIGFPGLDRTQGQAPMPDSHLFRVEGGKIKYCHTASACVVDGCGLNGTTFGRRRGVRPVSLRG